MPSFLEVPHRGRKFALLTILFLPAGALILEAVDNSFTEHERKCFLIRGRNQVKTVMVIESEVLTS